MTDLNPPREIAGSNLWRRRWAVPSLKTHSEANVLFPERRFHLAMTALAILSAGVSIYGVNATGIVIARGQLLSSAVLPAFLLLLACFYAWRRVATSVNLIMATFWAVLFSKLHLFPMFIAARHHVEFSDARLAGWDRRLGVEVPAILNLIARWPVAMHALEVCYDTLLPFMVLAIVVLPLCGQMRASKEYLLGVAVSGSIAMPLFAFFQARGPWIYYGYSPAIDQDNYTKTFAALKADRLFAMDLGFRDGLICFPSFHTILAVLVATALWPIPYVRWAAVSLATLIIVSTITTGTHYLVDVVAGLLVGAAAIAIARAYTAGEERWLAPRVRNRLLVGLTSSTVSPESIPARIASSAPPHGPHTHAAETPSATAAL